MGGFVKGDVVVISFPFSDMSGAKNRPALILATLRGSDLILCQITSQCRDDGYSIDLSEGDFRDGKLTRFSYIRPNHIFTTEQSKIKNVAGKITRTKMDEVVKKVIEILES